ncbi:hypothetical protein SLAV_31820 [Streptomyces lavendulae subsp. lavendulae]|uniref:Uncharacterized protein n=1 Tax=Streptomyces lavendulae subsp. lavendulae TaxID=58340 RepID=A0A2K8PN18_STRLA|nr:hypothetical protein [Streptomyces lavendulae]ATZ28136.1 hypothetical protein SLAV_31820 [Streptomyces lavendulae subsp. lavendulae]QUQ57964.1 hypothetical protein SLLC_29990 [Streptomyces lavendulae subsp. lavendulae]
MAENAVETVAGGTGGAGTGDATGRLPAVLADEMTRELRRWRVATFNYGVTYYLSRILLIAASAIVAADQNLGGGKAASLIAWVPMLALVVAVLTAVDTWLKPQQKWRGFMESRDALADLMIQAGDGMAPREVREKFLELRKQHRERNVF